VKAFSEMPLHLPRYEMPEGYSYSSIGQAVLFGSILFHSVPFCSALWTDVILRKDILMNMSLCAIKFSLYCQNCLVINTS